MSDTTHPLMPYIFVDFVVVGVAVVVVTLLLFVIIFFSFLFFFLILFVVFLLLPTAGLERLVGFYGNDPTAKATAEKELVDQRIQLMSLQQQLQVSYLYKKYYFFICNNQDEGETGRQRAQY